MPVHPSSATFASHHTAPLPTFQPIHHPYHSTAHESALGPSFPASVSSAHHTRPKDQDLSPSFPPLRPTYLPSSTVTFAGSPRDPGSRPMEETASTNYQHHHHHHHHYPHFSTQPLTSPPSPTLTATSCSSLSTPLTLSPQLHHISRSYLDYPAKTLNISTSLSQIALEAAAETRTRRTRRRLRTWRAGGWVVGVGIESWLVFLAVRYFVGWVYTPQNTTIRHLNLAFFIFTLISTIPILVVLLLLPGQHAQRSLPTIIPPTSRTTRFSDASSESRWVRSPTFISLHLFLFLFSTLPQTLLALIQLTLFFLFKTTRASTSIAGALGFMGRCGWDMDVVWNVPVLSNRDREGCGQTYRWDGWGGVLGARLGGTVLLYVLLHLSLFQCFRLITLLHLTAFTSPVVPAHLQRFSSSSRPFAKPTLHAHRVLGAKKEAMTFGASVGERTQDGDALLVRPPLGSTLVHGEETDCGHRHCCRHTHPRQQQGCGCGSREQQERDNPGCPMLESSGWERIGQDFQNERPTYREGEEEETVAIGIEARGMELVDDDQDWNHHRHIPSLHHHHNQQSYRLAFPDIFRSGRNQPQLFENNNEEGGRQPSPNHLHYLADLDTRLEGSVYQDPSSLYDRPIHNTDLHSNTTAPYHSFPSPFFSSSSRFQPHDDGFTTAPQRISPIHLTTRPLPLPPLLPTTSGSLFSTRLPMAHLTLLNPSKSPPQTCSYPLVPPHVIPSSPSSSSPPFTQHEPLHPPSPPSPLPHPQQHHQTFPPASSSTTKRHPSRRYLRPTPSKTPTGSTSATTTSTTTTTTSTLSSTTSPL